VHNQRIQERLLSEPIPIAIENSLSGPGYTKIPMPVIQKQAHSDGLFHCPKSSCEKAYSTWSDMNKCARRHFKEYGCGQCPHRSASVRDIKRHIDSHISIPDPFFCGICQVSFGRKDNMQRHEAECRKKGMVGRDL